MERLCNNAHLASRALVPAPGLHDKWIIDGDADDLLDPLPFDISSLLHVAGEVGLAAAGGEGSGHAEHHNLDKSSSNIIFRDVKTPHLLPLAELRQPDLASRTVLEQSHVRNLGREASLIANNCHDHGEDN